MVAAIESGAVDDPVVPFEGPAVLAVDVLGDFVGEGYRPTGRAAYVRS